MDIKQFFNLLKHYKWILIIIPFISIGLTYFFVKDLPKNYRSKAQISTGLIDQSQQIASANNNQDFFKVSSQFANILEIMKMDKTISMLSYNLILHDLEYPSQTFVKWSEDIKKLSENERKVLVSEYKKLLATQEVLTPALNGKFKLFDILASMGYDVGSLNKNLNIYHVDNSDFITVEYTSASPMLSTFAVNTYASEFINVYSIDVSANQSKSNVLLDSLLRQKEFVMNEKNNALKDYKIKNGVLNLDKQSENIYQQINEFEKKKSDALRDIQSNQGAIASINSRLTGGDEAYSNTNTAVDNSKIADIKNQLKVANDRYIDNNFRPADKKKIDSLQRMLSFQITTNSERNTVDPATNKQSLMTQKMNLEVTLDLAKNSIKSIDQSLDQLRSKYNTMVPYDAGVQNFERDADVATKEYLSVLNKTNENSLEKNMGLKLRLAQAGFPGLPESSKKILFIALSAVASFTVCFCAILVVFLLDNSVNTPFQLQKLTNSRVLGKLNLINSKNVHVRAIWKDEGHNSEFIIYKDLLRSLRFEIDQLLSADKSNILGITSLCKGEGKTFLASSLVYAFAMTGKKVLLISGEKNAHEIMLNQKSIPDQFFETFIVKKEVQIDDLITVMNNQSEKTSLFEIESKENLNTGFNFLKDQFDLIIVDITSLENINRAKEWLLFTEKNIAVFESGRTINEKSAENIEYIIKHTGFIGWVLNKQVES